MAKQIIYILETHELRLNPKDDRLSCINCFENEELAKKFVSNIPHKPHNNMEIQWNVEHNGEIYTRFGFTKYVLYARPLLSETDV